jgi:N-acetylglucosamine repressor
MKKFNTRGFTRATRSTPREINRQILLNLVREHQPISRADLARRIGMGRGMVTSLARDLLAEGAILEGQLGDAPRGRKPTMLYVRTRDRLVVAIDVRFSRTYVMLTDFAGGQLSLESFETRFDPAELIAELGRRVRRLKKSYAGKGEVEGIGLVVPGMVDREAGRVLSSPQLGWREVDVRGPLERATGLPVHMENAPVACALAHMWLGQRSGDGAGDFVYVTVSDGVGAGMVINGQVVRGHDNTAGEFGHIPLSLEGPPCLCGASGCWEAYTSNLATVARYLGQEPMPGKRLPAAEEAPTFEELVSLAREGDPRAVATLRETGRYLGFGLAMVVNAINPPRIIVGGEITAAWDLIEADVAAAVAARALTPAAARTPIVPEQTSVHPRLQGATALVAALGFAAPRVA